MAKFDAEKVSGSFDGKTMTLRLVSPETPVDPEVVGQLCQLAKAENKVEASLGGCERFLCAVAKGTFEDDRLQVALTRGVRPSLLSTWAEYATNGGEDEMLVTVEIVDPQVELFKSVPKVEVERADVSTGEIKGEKPYAEMTQEERAEVYRPRQKAEAAE
jgi:hypothetical protein